jgi:hypothetical protein
MRNEQEPAEAQIKEFWEWCGFTVELCHHKYCAYGNKNHTHIYPPDKVGRSVDYGAVNDYPKLDFNNLFEFAVPLVLKSLEKQGYVIPLAGFFDRWYTLIVDLKLSPKNALFWVCEEVIHAKN